MFEPATSHDMVAQHEVPREVATDYSPSPKKSSKKKKKKESPEKEGASPENMPEPEKVDGVNTTMVGTVKLDKKKKKEKLRKGERIF